MIIKAEPALMYQGKRVVIREFAEWAAENEKPRTFKEAADRWGIPYRVIADLSDALGFGFHFVNIEAEIGKPKKTKRKKGDPTHQAVVGEDGKVSFRKVPQEWTVGLDFDITAESLIVTNDAQAKWIDENLGAGYNNVAQDSEQENDA